MIEYIRDSDLEYVNDFMIDFCDSEKLIDSILISYDVGFQYPHHT